ncbi:MAG: DUF192 domain-containing protein [Candidatus Vogelbacteria bacterium]|nr:DUF192 domain-containing protein [Candidatus Vogelbacteria bacterium]
MKSYLFYLLIILLAGISVYSIANERFNDRSNGQTAHAGNNPTTAIIPVVNLAIGKAKITAEVVETPAERERGLSGRTVLPENEGMLFVFDRPGQHKFWMKDMNFPIDIIWLGPNKIVIDITANLATSTYPNSVTSRVPAFFALEVNASWAEKNEIKIGDQATIKNDEW